MWQSKGQIVFLEAAKTVWELEDHVARLVPTVTPRMRLSEKGLYSNLEHAELGSRSPQAVLIFRPIVILSKQMNSMYFQYPYLCWQIMI